jgi:hypothetical protein
MISAGNDIVSLTATNVTRTKSPEFYSKIISRAEKALFNTLNHEALPFDRFVWLLWSVKESAFKYLHRLDPELVFTPVKFEVQSIVIPPGYSCTESDADEITGIGFTGLPAFNATIAFAGKKLFSRTVVYKEYVSSVVNHTEDFDGIYWGIKRIGDTSYKYQSAAVREFALGSLHAKLGFDNLAIKKSKDDVPFLLSYDKQLETPISLSHHGQWIAFSFQGFY